MSPADKAIRFLIALNIMSLAAGLNIGTHYGMWYQRWKDRNRRFRR